MNGQTLLVELLTEELPPKSLARLGESFRESMQKGLAEAGFIAADQAGRFFATPRRLAVQFDDVLEVQPERVIERKGPAVASGVDVEGRPTKALDGFMRSAGVAFEQLERLHDGKAEYFVARLHKAGEPLERHLAGLVDGALKKLPIARLMRWGDTDHQFVRPVHGLIMMLGGRVIPGQVLGLESGDVTRGHRFLCGGEIVIPDADAYERVLEEQGRVMACFSHRREKIRNMLEDAAARLQARLRPSEDLLDEVTALVEWPAVYVGEFEPEFLAVPQECLILTMQLNQKYFPLFDAEGVSPHASLPPEGAAPGLGRPGTEGVSPHASLPPEGAAPGLGRPGTGGVSPHAALPPAGAAPGLGRPGTGGRLLNRFLIVSNMAVEDPRHIVGGNQRVVRPRLADARFFFEQDRKRKLEHGLARLENVVYHHRLGSVAQRVGRLERLATAIAHRLHADAHAAGRAARLAKADLVSDMVGEFPELQGVMGRYYALHDGETQVVADAIEAHYRPRFAGDALPHGNVACAVALADKLDALTGFFGIGQVPTGDKDPFGLRRAALGVLRILAETPLPLDLVELIGLAAGGFPDDALSTDPAAALHDFMLERLRHWLREAGQPQDCVEAVVGQRPTRIDHVVPRIEAVRAFVALPEAQALAAANKRIVNILRKASEEVPAEPDLALFQEPAERELFHRMIDLAPEVHSAVANEDYTAALKALAGLRAPVDTFFDAVLVMADEPLTRCNRLALLTQLAALMNQVADISRLSAGGAGGAA